MSSKRGTHTMKYRSITLLLSLFVLASALALAQSNGQPEHFTANAVSLSPEYGTGQQVVDIDISRWSPASERGRLVTALREKGADELLKRSEERRVGKECRSRWS